jgi:hypothetical protein
VPPAKPRLGAISWNQTHSSQPPRAIASRIMRTDSGPVPFSQTATPTPGSSWIWDAIDSRQPTVSSGTR